MADYLNRQYDDLTLALGCRHRNGKSVYVSRDRIRTAVQMRFDLESFEPARDLRTYVRIHHRQEAVQHFDDRYLDA